jgi:translation elongation factor EF-Tu-like GTPase
MGCLLRGVKREQVRRGQVIVTPGSMKAVKKFQSQIYVRETCSFADPVSKLGPEIRC